MVDGQLLHREVLRVTGREPPAHGEGRRRNEAIGLGESRPCSGVISPPFPGLPPFGGSERSDAQTGEEVLRGSKLFLPQSANRLLDVDGAGMRPVAGVAQSRETGSGARPAAQQVDEHCRVEEDVGHVGG